MMGSSAIHNLLWRHKDPGSTQIFAFQRHIETTYRTHFTDYEELRQWSINNLDSFWQEVWRFTGVVASMPFSKVI